MNSQHNLPTARPLRRLLALIYDTLLVLAISMGYGAAVLLFKVLLFGPASTAHSLPVGGIGFQLGWLLTIVGFFCFFWRKNGQTLGMRAWRLRLIDSRDTHSGQLTDPSWPQCLQRCLIAPFSLVLAGIGYLWCYFDREGKSLHDRLTGTQVVVLPKRSKPNQNLA